MNKNNNCQITICKLAEIKKLENHWEIHPLPCFSDGKRQDNEKKCVLHLNRTPSTMVIFVYFLKIHCFDEIFINKYKTIANKQITNT